jgi:hypothetical protein
MCTTVTLPVVLYGSETRSVTLREEHRLRVFKGRVLREIFGSKRDVVTGNWRRLHDKYLHDLQETGGVCMISIFMIFSKMEEIACIFMIFRKLEEIA